MAKVNLDDYGLEVDELVATTFERFLSGCKLSIKSFVAAHGPLAVIVQQPDPQQRMVFSITVATPRNFSAGTLRTRLRELLVQMGADSDTMWQLTSIFGILWNRELLAFSDFGRWMEERGFHFNWAIQHNNAIRMFNPRAAMEIKLRWVDID